MPVIKTKKYMFCTFVCPRVVWFQQRRPPYFLNLITSFLSARSPQFDCNRYQCESGWGCIQKKVIYSVDLSHALVNGSNPSYHHIISSRVFLWNNPSPSNHLPIDALPTQPSNCSCSAKQSGSFSPEERWWWWRQHERWRRQCKTGLWWWEWRWQCWGWWGDCFWSIRWKGWYAEPALLVATFVWKTVASAKQRSMRERLDPDVRPWNGLRPTQGLLEGYDDHCLFPANSGRRSRSCNDITSKTPSLHWGSDWP